MTIGYYKFSQSTENLYHTAYKSLKLNSSPTGSDSKVTWGEHPITKAAATALALGFFNRRDHQNARGEDSNGELCRNSCISCC